MRRGFWRWRLCLGAALFAAAAGCDPGTKPPAPTSQPIVDQVEPPASRPTYGFAAGLAEEHPEIVGFLREFLETSLVGDYGGYRRLVARGKDPESRARFEKVLNSLRALQIESIAEVKLPATPPPTYLVVARAELDPTQRVALRRGQNNRVAILVLQEQGEWRMAPAPADLQPQETTQPASSEDSASKPAAPPEYPWDQDRDY